MALTLPLFPCGARAPIREASEVGAARRLAVRLATRLELGEETVGRVALVVTEAATNLLRHAGGGEILVAELRAGERRGVEVLALDQGPGIDDLARALAGGMAATPKGSLGHGLGAIRRLSDTFDVHTSPETGTVVLSKLWQPLRWPPPAPAPEPSLLSGAVCLPKPGERRCGDAWALCELAPGRHLVVVVDGLGHGSEAAEAADRVLALLDSLLPAPELAPIAFLELTHETLRGSRGAVAGAALLDEAADQLRFAGIGNIQGAVMANGRRRGLVSFNGTLGFGGIQVQELVYDWPPGASLILHSDGLAAIWELGRYRGLSFRDPALVAAVLYRDFSNHRDDATVLALRRLAAEVSPSGSVGP